jgi:DNA-binding NarL/FixJ family response regulator
MIRILLVDDQKLIRQGMHTLLTMEGDLEVVGEASNGVDAIAAVEQFRPDVVLMDVRMPQLDGVAATRAITERFPNVAIIILTTFDDDEYVFEGLKAGARGYLLKDVGSEEIAAAIRVVAAGGALMQPSIARKVMAEFGRMAGSRASPTLPASPPSPAQSTLPEPLTERELDVLRALASGLSNREIAEQLVITEGTVKNHVSNLLAKLNARDRTQAILRAQALRLI